MHYSEPNGAELEGPGYRPRPWLPHTQQLTYTKEFVTVLLLLLALPWVIKNLLVSPARLAKIVGGRAVT
jgi:hypothetical protein